MENKYNNFLRGLKSGIPIAIGYIPIALTFGLLAKSSGIPNIVSISMSVIVFAGASQFMAVKLIALGATFWEIVFATFILNFRHFLMSSSLAQRITKGVPGKILGLIAFGITDETFSVASLQKERELNPQYLLGLNFSAYLSWVTGTCAGIFLAASLPQTVKSSMGIALYAMFIGLLVPAFRNSGRVLLIALIAIFVNSLLSWISFFSSIAAGWKIIIATIIAAGIGAVLYPGGIEECQKN